MKDNKTKKNVIKEIKIKNILLLIFIAIFIYSFISILKWGIDNIVAKKQNDDLIKDIVQIEKSAENEHSNEQSERITVNFEELKNINEDIVGWIYIEGTKINYPIVQAVDNSYYLNHTIKKEYNLAGSIFMDFENNKDFIDKNTIIYGHKMQSGLMFGELYKIQNGDLGKKLTIQVITPKEYLEYEVFSSYTKDNKRFSINTFDGKTYEEFLKDIKSKSNIDFEKDVNTDNRMITLSTCGNNSNKERLVVHAILK